MDTGPCDEPTGEPVHVVQPLGGGGSPSPESK
jgi:hypothetical protein